jgi:hypothetical protein
VSNSLKISLTDRIGEGFFVHAESCRSNEAFHNIKFKAPNLKVSGVREERQKC